jgi:hypothetical protein
MAEALLDLIGDSARRAEMAAAAVRHSARYDPGPVAERYEQLFADLAQDRARRRVPWLKRLAARLRRGVSRHRGESAGVLTGSRRPAAPVLGPAGHNYRPVADCTVAPCGELLLRLPAGSLPVGATLGWQRVEKGTPRTAAVAVPSVRDDGVTVTIGADDVPPGSWALQIIDGARRTPVAAGMRDTRALLDADESPDGGVHVRMPYRGPDGSLQVRVWKRRVHPEVGQVSVHGDEIRFDGRLLGAKFGSPVPHLELRCRVPGSPVVHAPVQPVDEITFHVVLPARLPAAHRTAAAEDLWDIWLHYDEGAAPVRLGRLLDDVVDKRSAYLYPDAVVRRPDRRDLRVQPYYTLHNEFSVRVADRAP